jgi:hypothetical protein
MGHQGSRLARFWQAGMGRARFAKRGGDPREAEGGARLTGAAEGGAR